MSEQAVTTTAPEAAPAVAPEAPQQVDTSLSGPDLKRALKTQQRTENTARLQASEPPAETPAEAELRTKPNRAGQEQPIDEAGRYASPEGAPDPAAAAPQPEPAAEAPATPPDGLVRVPVPEDHPLRAQGINEIPTTPEQERSLRALLNSHTRRAEVEAAEQRAMEAERRALHVEAELRAIRESRDNLLKDPMVAAKYAEIREVYGEQDAEAFLAGKLKEFDGRADEYRKEAEAQLVQRQRQQQVQEFDTAVYSLATERYNGLPIHPQTMQELMRQARFQYGTEIDYAEALGQPVQLDHVRLFGYLDRLVMGQPGVVDALRQRNAAKQQEALAAAEQKARQEAEEAQRQELLRAAEARKTINPVGNIASTVATGAATTAPEVVDTSKLHGHDLKRTLKQQARETARSIAGALR